ncbi:MAG: FAD-dependent oxidoreductase, partial [Polyangiales bacterium]
KLKAKDSLHEVEWILDLGVELRTNVSVGEQGVRGSSLLSEYDAVFIGVGLGDDSKLGVPGEDGPGVIGAIDWIERMKLAPEKPSLGRVLVIGGGNTAIDVARECAQLGAREVSLVYRKTKHEMSGYAHEMEAARIEGVTLMEQSVAVSFQRENGKLVGARLKTAGTEHDVPCDLVVVAIGQSKLRAIASELGVELDARGCVVVDEHRRTKNPKVFAGGDCVNGGKEVVNAVADGRDAARFLLAQWGI